MRPNLPIVLAVARLGMVAATTTLMVSLGMPAVAQDPSVALPLASPQASPVASPSASPVAPFVSGGTTVPSLEDTMDASIVVAELDGYAGHYLVPERQYMPVYLWVGDMGGLAATLTDLLGEDAAFEIHPAARTFTELQTIVDGVRELYPEFYARDMLIVSIATDVKQNRVEVGVAGKLKEARRLLAPLGDAVVVRRRAVPNLD
jgi:hypothetical protein